MTEWNAFRSLDLPRLKRVMNQANFIDFRLIYSHDELSAAGFNSYILGRGIIESPKTFHHSINPFILWLCEIDTIQQTC